MTTRHALTDPTTASSTPAKRHLRLTPEAEVTRTEAGRFAVPLNLHEGDAEAAALPLVLTADEVVILHSKLGALFPIAEGETR